MARKNHDRGRPQARRSPWADMPQPLRRSVERMPVLPISGSCPGPRHRLRYASAEIAASALAQVRKDRLAKGHPESSIEKRAYECDITGCGGWHLTSRTFFEKRPPR